MNLASVKSLALCVITDLI